MPRRAPACRRVRQLVLWLGLLGLLVRHSTAAGQGEAPPDEYRQLIGAAVIEFDQGNWAEARSLLERAHGLKPGARTLRGLGLTSFELRHYVEAVHELQSALDDQRYPLSAEQRVDVQRTLDRARGFVGTVHVEVLPANAVLTLNGVLVDKRDFRLNAGDYRFAASSPGFRASDVTTYVAGGREQTLTLTLLAADSAQSAPPSAVRTDVDSDPSLLRPIASWTLVGAGVVAIAVGVVFELKRADKLSERDAICPSSMNCTIQDQRDIDALTKDARAAATMGAIGLIAGAVVAAGGLTLLITTPSPERKALSLAPQLSPRAQGLVLTGTF
ncbi:MAG: tetratricopeptide repeat protein [Polyangiales bacterium]